MKILLVKPVGPVSYISIDGPDLGFGYLAAHLRKAGIDVGLVNCPREQVSHDQLVERVRAEGADVVGFKVFTKDVPSVRESARRIRAALPGVLLVAGGAHVSAVPMEAPTHLPELDFLIAGEAENALPRFLQCMDRGRKGGRWDREAPGLDEVPGLVRRTANGKPVVNPQDFVDLSRIGMPAWDLLHPDRFTSYGFRTRGPYIPIQTGRGCAFHCTFCSVARINGRKSRLRPVSDVIEELRHLRDAFGIRHFSIIDDDFLGVRSHVEAFLDALIEADLGMEWEACSNGIRLNKLDPPLIRKLERSGCYAVAVAVESGSPRTLRRMRKSLTVEEIAHYTAMLAANSSILMHGFLILGYPGETWSDILATIVLARRLPLHTVDVFLFTPHPGTEIYEELVREGKLDGIDFGRFLYEMPTIDVEGLPAARLDLVQRAAYLLLNARPTVFWRLIRRRGPLYFGRFCARRIDAFLSSRRAAAP